MSVTDEILTTIRIHRPQIEQQGAGWLEIKYGPDGVRAFLRPVGRRDLGAIVPVDRRRVASVK